MRYTNVFMRRGGLGQPPVMWASKPYPTAREAVEGQVHLPDAGFTYVGTLDNADKLFPRGSQFVSTTTLVERFDTEEAPAVHDDTAEQGPWILKQFHAASGQDLYFAAGNRWRIRPEDATLFAHREDALLVLREGQSAGRGGFTGDILVTSPGPVAQSAAARVERQDSIPGWTPSEARDLTGTPKVFANGYTWEMDSEGFHRIVSPEGVGGDWALYSGHAVSVCGHYVAFTLYYGDVPTETLIRITPYPEAPTVAAAPAVG